MHCSFQARQQRFFLPAQPAGDSQCRAIPVSIFKKSTPTRKIISALDQRSVLFLQQEAHRPPDPSLLGRGRHGKEKLLEVGVEHPALDEAVAFRLQQAPVDFLLLRPA